MQREFAEGEEEGLAPARVVVRREVEDNGDEAANILDADGLRGALCSSAFGGVGIGLAYGGGDGGRARELDDAGYGEQKVCRRGEGFSQGGAHLGLRKVRRDGYPDS